MQANNNNNKTNVHVKVEYNQEYRRFVVETLSFENLEKNLRTLLNIDSAQPIKILFLDDEKDWVLLASDSELAYAWELSASLLRLSVKSLPAPVLTPVFVNHHEVFTHHPFHHARGRGCHGRGAGCRAGRVGCMNRGDPTMQMQFIESKLARLTERHAMLTAKLPEMPEERARALAWRISHLENKIEKIQWKKESFTAANLAEQLPVEETPAEKVTEEPAAASEEPAAPCWGGRGRGCRRGGRGGCHNKRMGEGAETHPQFEAVMAKKVELKTARQGGNKEEIQAKWEALQEAKDTWRAAKRAQLIARKQTQ